jgi:diguanylate cyclase (GGDEF)-like protein/PAS domain S-box-containing protein
MSIPGSTSRAERSSALSVEHGRRPSRWRSYLAGFLVSVAVAGLSAGYLNRLHDTEIARQQETLALTEVHLLINAQHVVEEQVRGRGFLSAEADAQLSGLRLEIERERLVFERLESDGEREATVAAAIERYQFALDHEMALFASARILEADAISDDVVDAGFEDAVAVVEAIEHEELALAERLHVRVTQGIFLSLGFAVAMIGAVLVFVGHRLVRSERAETRGEAERASEKRLAALTSNASDAVALVNSDGLVTYQSASFASVLGYDTDSLLGQQLNEIIDSQDTAQVAAAWSELIDRADSVRSLQCRVRHVDGTPRLCELSLRNLLDVPEVASVVVNVRDITARATADEALRASETQLREAQALARLGSWRTELTTALGAWSDETYTILGADHDVEPSFEAFLAAIHPDDVAAFTAVAERVMGAGETATSECRIVRPDGEVRWVSSGASVLRDDTGAVSTIYGTLHDITESRLAQQALSDSENRLKEAQALAHIGNWRVDLHNGEVSWSDELYRLHGFEPDAFTPTLHDFVSFVHPEDRERAEGHARRLLSNGDPIDVEFRIVRPNGEVRWMHSQGSASQHHDGQADDLFGTTQDITDRKQIEKELAHQALHDPLTDLANRTLFRDHVEHAVHQAARSDAVHAVLFIDLDNFKHVNDSLGHSAGDELLRIVGTRLQAGLRIGDTVARLGGDEFAVLLEDTSAEAAATVAASLLEALRPPTRIEGQDVVISASIGIAMGDKHSAPDQQLRAADVALYAAKAAGKGRFEWFAPHMHEAALRRLELEGDLRRALDAGELRVHYQPIVDLVTNEVVGAEALARWTNPRHGEIAPDEFIPLAEETGLIRPLGAFVLREACEQARTWKDRHHRDFRLTVNVSIRQLEAPGFPSEVMECLRATGLESHSLTLEVTESMVMQQADACVAALEELKARGVKLAIDDFGTGYSSLSYLPSLPISALKIDRSFVNEVMTGGEAAAVVRAVVELAGAFSLDTIAEGVEDPQQAVALRAIGCRFAQGFWFSRPLPDDAMGRYLDDQWPLGVDDARDEVEIEDSMAVRARPRGGTPMPAARLTVPAPLTHG